MAIWPEHDPVGEHASDEEPDYITGAELLAELAAFRAAYPGAFGCLADVQDHDGNALADMLDPDADCFRQKAPR
jgi:hypothetical protein